MESFEQTGETRRLTRKEMELKAKETEVEKLRQEWLARAGRGVGEPETPKQEEDAKMEWKKIGELRQRWVNGLAELGKLENENNPEK